MILYFVVHAFTDSIFSGNPAGVCPLDEWIDDTLMQKIATENGLSETAFFVPNESGYDLRWFTPKNEVDLCGHATLSSAYVLFHHLDYEHDVILFKSKSGDLPVGKIGQSMVLDFPSREATECDVPKELEAGIGKKLHEVYKARDYLVVLSDEDEVRAIEPNYSKLEKLDATGVIITAPGEDVDFVSR